MKKSILISFAFLAITHFASAQSTTETSAEIAPLIEEAPVTKSNETVEVVPTPMPVTSEEEESSPLPQETKAEVKIDKPKVEKGWRFHLRPDFNFSRIEATDSAGNKAVVASKNINPGLKFGVNTEIADKLSVGLTLGAWYSNLHTDSSDKLKNAKNPLWRAGLGLNYRFLDRFAIGAEGAYANRLFISRPNSTTLSIEQISLPEAWLNARWDLIKAQAFTLGLGGGVGQVFSGKSDKIDMDASTFYRGNLYTVFHGHSPIVANIYFEKGEQDSNLGKLETTTVGFAFAIITNSFSGDQ